jgi:hypothetical protein
MNKKQMGTAAPNGCCDEKQEYLKTRKSICCADYTVNCG